jgi:hypothetical protein
MRARPQADVDETDRADDSAFVRRLPRAWRPVLPTPRLPIGVALLALAVAVLGVVLVAAGIFALGNQFVAGWIPLPKPILAIDDPLADAIVALLGGVLLAVATALWRQEVWAFALTLGALFFGLIFLFFTASITVAFLLVLVVFIYLLAVRRHFY